MRTAFLVFAVAACGGTDDGKIKVAIPADHVATVNGLVPAEWKGKVEFELGTVVDKRGRANDTYRLALPKGWKPAFMPGSLQPGDADDFGRSAAMGAVMSMRVGSNCNGECIAKDWAAEVDKAFYKKFTAATTGGKVIGDERSDTGRTLVFERAAGDGQPAEINILTTWWKKGGPQHFICEVKLEDAAVAMAPAFEKACSLVSVE